MDDGDVFLFGFLIGAIAMAVGAGISTDDAVLIWDTDDQKIIKAGETHFYLSHATDEQILKYEKEKK